MTVSSHTADLGPKATASRVPRTRFVLPPEIKLVILFQATVRNRQMYGFFTL